MEAFTIKPLEWVGGNIQQGAASTFGTYRVTSMEDGRWAFRKVPYDSLGLAKAAAEAAYRQRVMQMLEPVHPKTPEA